MKTVSINTLRTLAIDAIQKANSGHPGLPLGAAPMAYVLWREFLRFDPKDPAWPDRDRFVLSGGHGSMLLYGLLHLAGYDLSLDDLKAFRQWESRTPGHPEFGLTPGVEATTGPLGQGAANSVGMAIAEVSLRARFGPEIVDHRTYALVTDGDIMEGLVAEAASYAGFLGLGRLIWLYDDNDISLDGPTAMTLKEDVGKRFEAYGWRVLVVEKGDTDLDGIRRAIETARAESKRPTLIRVKTTIGFGSPAKAGTSDAHGTPLGAEEVAKTKTALGWDPALHFHVPDEVRADFAEGAARGVAAHAAWRERFVKLRAKDPAKADEFERRMRGELPAGWDRDLPSFPAGKAVATRDAGGKIMNALAARLPEFLGGDADLSCSTKTTLDNLGDLDAANAAGRNLHFGIREHAMGAISNGMAYHGGVRPFTATFLAFSDYMRPAIRLAAMNRLPVVFVFTHDSVGLGEDGPTHQPVEHAAALRAIPGLAVVRPGDANETREAWRTAIGRTHGPTALLLTRQKVATHAADVSGAARGGYVLVEASSAAPRVLLLATGSEVEIAVAAREILEKEGLPARVVSMTSWEVFAAQDAAYRESVLPKRIRARVAIEAGGSLGWERWVGDSGAILAVDRYGASAPYEVIYEKFGLTAANLARVARGVAKS